MPIPSTTERLVRALRWLLPLLLVALVIVLVLRPVAKLGDLLGGSERTSVTHSLVVEKVQAVSELVSSETTVRDVIVYENVLYGSRKGSLVVVTGKILAGIDLKAGSDVSIDDAAKRITIRIPGAQVLAVEISEMRNSEERSGLWNPFTPADRNAIFRLARAQIERAGRDMGIIEHANRSAKELLETMFTTDGYKADVVVSGPAPV